MTKMMIILSNKINYEVFYQTIVDYIQALLSNYNQPKVKLYSKSIYKKAKKQLFGI